MKKRMGLRINHAKLVEELLQSVDYSLNANSVRDRLWELWGRNAPTCREIGTFLNLHPNTIRMNGKNGPAEYQWFKE
jgi:hypothetical protein